MKEPSLNGVQGTLILAELQNIRAEIKQALRGREIGGEKRWLKPAEFSKLCGLSTRTLATYAINGRFSEQAVRQVRRGSSFTNEFHRVKAMNELQKWNVI